MQFSFSILVATHSHQIASGLVDQINGETAKEREKFAAIHWTQLRKSVTATARKSQSLAIGWDGGDVGRPPKQLSHSTMLLGICLVERQIALFERWQQFL